MTEAKGIVTQAFSAFAIEILNAADLNGILTSIGDYDGMDPEQVMKTLMDLRADKPALFDRHYKVMLTFLLKNGGNFGVGLKKMNHTSGKPDVQAAYGFFQFTTKAAASSPGALTPSRFLAVSHTIVIGVIQKLEILAKWKPAADVVLLVKLGGMFHSTYAPYLYSKAADDGDLVYKALCEWALAHHKKVNPDKVDEKGNLKKGQVFNSGLFKLKIEKSMMGEREKRATTGNWLRALKSEMYSPGSIFPELWKDSKQHLLNLGIST